MLDLNEEVKDSLPFYSLRRLSILLRSPNFYFATSVQDFLENKNRIKPSGRKLFPIDEHQEGRAYIGLANLRCRVNFPLELEGWDEFMLNILQIYTYSDWQLKEEAIQHREVLLQKFYNAHIYDMTGELEVYCAMNIPQNVSLSHVLLEYKLNSNLLKVYTFSHGPPQAKEAKNDLEGYIFGLLPQGV